MIVPLSYDFYYNDAYPTKGWRLHKINPLTGDTVGYVNDYPTYRKILLSKPELKRHYYPNDAPADKRVLLGALRSLKNHNYDHDFVIKLAMRMGTLPEDLERLIKANNPSYNSIPVRNNKLPDIIDLSDLGPPSKLDRKDSDIVDLNKLSSKKKTDIINIDNLPSKKKLPDIIDIGRKKRRTKIKSKRKPIKKCKCKK